MLDDIYSCCALAALGYIRPVRVHHSPAPVRPLVVAHPHAVVDVRASSSTHHCSLTIVISIIVSPSADDWVWQMCEQLVRRMWRRMWGRVVGCGTECGQDNLAWHSDEHQFRCTVCKAVRGPWSRRDARARACKWCPPQPPQPVGGGLALSGNKHRTPAEQANS